MGQGVGRVRIILACVGVAIAASAAATASAQGIFTPPPRTISDVIAVLEQQKPNEALVARRRQAAAAEPPAGASGQALANFYYQRALAKSALGRPREAIADGQLALENAERSSRLHSIVRQFVVGQYMINLEPRKALSAALEWAKELGPSAPLNARLSNGSQIVRNQIAMGDLAAAEATLKSLDQIVERSDKNATPEQRDLYSDTWHASVENARGRYFAAHGRWKEAEASLVKAEAGYADGMAKRPRWPNGPDIAIMQQASLQVIAFLSQTRRAQGRLAEAEVDARRALLAQLGTAGKYHTSTARLCLVLGMVMRDEGRFADYEQLARASRDILRHIGFADDSDQMAAAQGSLANALRLQEHWSEAAEALRDVDKVVANWEPARKAAAIGNPGRVFILYNTGQVEAGIEAARIAVSVEKGRVGTSHFDYAIAQGNLAIGLTLANRIDDARAAFQVALPILTAPSGDDDDNEGAMPAARQRTASRIIAAYIGLLARTAPPDGQALLAIDTFALSDSLRGHSVAGAVAASSARVASEDSALAALARREQDLRKQVAANFGLLNAALALPQAQRDDAIVASLREQTTRRQAEHAKVRSEIGVRFPEYAELIDPKPASVEQIQAALRPGEAFLSIYFGAKSFVWAVPKSGPPSFAVIAANAAEIDAKVRKLREALEPNAASVSDIPAFDVRLAHELYTLLLKPVEQAWRPATTVVVATNGALGSLPLGVLPTAPADLPADSGAAFDAYRKIPWLARSHAIVMVPSAGAFRSLRSLPVAGMGRQPLIGFGDPLFNSAQAAEAAKQAPAPALSVLGPGTPLDRRSAPKVEGLASANLASLPRLPDTADELKSIAVAMQAKGDKVVQLGAAASEENVLSADLAKYRVVAFATHGLVAGELDGLTQPALALSAPDVTHGGGDGLLTLEKILGLKLNADWVVLSACNTGAGNGAGAEAASGLGRAFFYAGTRAILVTNWSVHSRSARDLVSDMFRRQAAAPQLSRAAALQQAELALMDGAGYRDDKGQTLFSYAHPLFWAPYSIIGDGG